MLKDATVKRLTVEQVERLRYAGTYVRRTLIRFDI